MADSIAIKSAKDNLNSALDLTVSYHSKVVPRPHEPYGPTGVRGFSTNPFIALCAIFSTLGGLLFGYDQGVVSVILVMPQFLDRFIEVGSGGIYKGLLTAMIELGALVGAFNQGWIADKISRKYSIVLAVMIFIIGSVLQTASVDYSILTVARLIGGIGIGMLSMVAPLYISEVSPPEIRGTLLVLEEFSIVTGIVIAFWITYGTRYMTDEWAWRLPFLVQILPALILGVGILFLPFSPRWLSSKGRDDESLVALARLRQLPTTDPRVQREWLEIRTEVALQRELVQEKHPGLQDKSKTSAIKFELAQWTDLFKPGCWRRTLVGIVIMFFQQLVGINALIYYSPTLFELLGLDYDMQLIMSGVLNICQLIGVTTSIFTMDRFGRRNLLLWGSLAMAIAHIIIAGLVGEYSHDWAAHSAEGWVSVTFLLIYMIAFGASWGPVPWALPSEIFPNSLRAKGVAASTCSNWLFNFIVGVVTPPLIDSAGYGTYIFFAAFCVLSGIWTYFCVPETMGKSLEDMDSVFGDASGKEDERRRLRIEQTLTKSHDTKQDVNSAVVTLEA